MNIKNYALLAMLFILTGTAFAQTPQYYVGGATSGGNSYPFGNSGGVGSKVQLLYLPTDFQTTPPSGNITNVYFRAYNATGYNGANNYVNLEVKLSMTSLSTLTSGASTFITPLTTVFFAATYSITFTQAQWFQPIVLSTPFPYTTGSNILVEVSLSSASATKYIATGNGSGVRRMWGTSGQSSTSNGDNIMYDIGFDIMTGPPCPVPTGLAASNIVSTGATLSWTPVAGSAGYDYLIDQNATVQYPNTPTTITGTSVNATGLTNSTNYYLHVRNRCSATNFSPWVTIPFTTLPPCKPPIGFHTTNLAYNFTNINWSVWPSAQSYDYVVDQSSANPTGTTGVINTTATSAPVPGLTENTWYFVHIRSLCAGNEISDWSLDSFLTPIVCRPPQLTVDHISVDEGVTYWPAIPTAYEYEYALTEASTPPAVGTKYQFTSIHTSALKDGKDYFMHVRAYCKSVEVFTKSDWSTVSFKTFALGVNNANGTELNLSVYPNPIKDKMYIELTGYVDGTATLQLTDVTGKVLKQVDVTTGKTVVDMAGQAPGIYMLKYSDLSINKTIKINKE
jgi:hypothetical protein